MHSLRIRCVRGASARDALEAWVRNACDFGRGRASGCLRPSLQPFVRCVYALSKLDTVKDMKAKPK